MLAANGAYDLVMLGNKGVHLVKGHRIDVHVFALLAVGNQLVGAVAALTGAAVQQRVREAGNVTGGHPGLGVHQDGGIQTHVVGAFLHELFQPCLFDVVLELNAQGTVVPAVGKTAVNFAARIDEPAVFAQVHDHIKGLFTVLHTLLLPHGWLPHKAIYFPPRRVFGAIATLYHAPPRRASAQALPPKVLISSLSAKATAL